MLILQTGLYDEEPPLRELLSVEGSGTGPDERVVERISVEPANMSPTDWDVLVEKVLEAERVVTL